MKKKKRKITNGTRRFKKYGVRNKLEQKVLSVLRDNTDNFEGYERDRLSYTVPESQHYYTPDFKVGDTYYEAKGIWDAEDRKKMLLVIAQYPHKKFVMVFYNQNYKIYKGSKTTYAMWCDKHQIAWTTPEQLTEELRNG